MKIRSKDEEVSESAQLIEFFESENNRSDADRPKRSTMRTDRNAHVAWRGAMHKQTRTRDEAHSNAETEPASQPNGVEPKSN